ncbi:MAG: molybdopterin molybdotransferase MoeA [Pseudonocardia sp.]|uniref:molybdotransferase-like divisome protein Glp n=1 Tax=unclassified Pseudonocardia TaxID=2619320 RepID=UPI00086E593A|nr:MULTISPECIES: gephyrin-like molybdotransferase Glp [unclassified Pseudonocardia]MBN9112836.1 molybdopterin molybdotransferase MoeA [Pseudonocardia sp.]ODV00180.1 MAG: molybdopterin molybdenumtransferase [Pseudonocardia sp. SCN 73-27]
MRSVDEQLQRVLAAAVRPAPVRVAIADAHGLRSAESVSVSRPLPGFDQAAIDGYAVRSVDLVGASEGAPVSLPVVGEIPAGSRQPLRLQPGQAVRVVAGAPLPTLADAVLPSDHTDSGSARIAVHRAVPSAVFVRRIGEDVQPGDVAVNRDEIIGTAQVAMLAAAGRGQVLVHPKPRVSVLAVGDELVDVSRGAGAGQVPDVCTHAIAAAAREAGAAVSRLRLVRADVREVRSALEDMLPFSEILVVCGAVAGRPGAELRSAFDGIGEIDDTRVAMHPGSSQGFGVVGRDAVPTFLFPSHPATALLLFEVLTRPLVRLGLGLEDPHRRVLQARLTSPVVSRKGRRGYVRGRLLREQGSGDYLLQPLGTSGTHLLTSLAEANGLLIVPDDVEDLTVDEQVSVAFLSNRR